MACEKQMRCWMCMLLLQLAYGSTVGALSVTSQPLCGPDALL